MPRLDVAHRDTAVWRPLSGNDHATMTTSPPYKELPDDRPTNAQTYWVVQYRWVSRPTRAVWNEARQTWRPAAGGGDVPWYIYPWYRQL